MRTSLIAGALCLALGALPGCKLLVDVIALPFESVAGSFTAIGGSLAGISVSSGSAASESGKDSEQKQSYARDLRQYVTLFMSREGTQQEFERGVTRIAEMHGIAHWEAEPVTPYAIGQGLAEAGVQAQNMDLLNARLTSNTTTADLVRKGWRDVADAR